MIRKPGESTWQQVSCIKMDRNMSYEVLVDNKLYRRNRIDIKPIRKEESEETNVNTEEEELTIIESGRLRRSPDRIIYSC